MNTKPNQTKLRGTIREIRPQPDGWGAEVDIEVEANVSPQADQDFLRPKSGSVMRFFASEPDRLNVGELVQATARLAFGPFGERAILEAWEQVGARDSHPPDRS
ncbi:MAG: hypothetical protein KDA38_08125 [Planctomycetales bacterium]|nr:hypothetical protein [Planctomycetales bacterium]